MRERIEQISEQILQKVESIVQGDGQQSLKDLLQITQLLQELIKLLGGEAASSVTVTMEGDVDGLGE